MLVSEFACPSCGTVIHPANPVRAGRQVQCYACRTTFVVPEKAESPPPPRSPSVQRDSPEPIHWTEEEEEDSVPAARLPQKRASRKKFLRPKDRLEGFWIAIIWGSLALPLIGSWIIVLLSSVMYYVWRKEYPKKARSINRHGWMAWLLGLLIWCPLWVALNRDQLGIVADQDGVVNKDDSGVANPNKLEHPGSVSNQARLIGNWEAEAFNRHYTMEYSADGQYGRWVRDFDGRLEHEEHGTWKIESESSNKVRIRTECFFGIKILPWTFEDDDTLVIEDRQFIYHRSRSNQQKAKSE